MVTFFFLPASTLWKVIKTMAKMAIKIKVVRRRILKCGSVCLELFGKGFVSWSNGACRVNDLVTVRRRA